MSWKIDRSKLKAAHAVATAATTGELTTRGAQRRAAAVAMVKRLAAALKAKLSWL